MKTHTTRFTAFSFTNIKPGLWRIIDNETGSAVGPQYSTKAELLSDLDRYAATWGY